MNIREATAADARRLAELRFRFRNEVGEAIEDRAAFVDRAAAWMAERLADGSRWRCWVAETDGGLAGHLWLQLIEKIPNPGDEREWHAYITNVYVTPEQRGRGIGERLMAAAMAFCEAEDVDSAILWPTAKSRSLYERFGFAAPADVMEAIVHEGRMLGGT